MPAERRKGMKKIIVMLLIVSLVCGWGVYAFASDWDVAGKVLTGIEGLRIFSGGKLDLIGNMFGMNRDRQDERSHYAYRQKTDCRRIWVPAFTWEKKWIPEHSDYDERLGKIIVEGHYVRYRVERGGHWQYDCNCRSHRD
jgi:hypothetical protein